MVDAEYRNIPSEHACDQRYGGPLALRLRITCKSRLRGTIPLFSAVDVGHTHKVQRSISLHFTCTCGHLLSLILGKARLANKRRGKSFRF